MIPRLIPDPSSRLVTAFTDTLRARGFAGDIAAELSHRTVFATDNSIYHVPPQAVLFPRATADVVLAMQVASEERFRSLPLVPRGGGTGTNGQSLTDGVVIDLSRHMNRVLSIDPLRRRVRVEAGIVKDQLNAALKPHGLFFAPDLSTSNRATIGGMIATDASGQGSCLYGKTHDHVLSLTTVLVDGTVWRSEPIEAKDLEAIEARDDRIGAIHRAVAAAETTSGGLFASVLPSLNRSVTGYDLVHVRDAAGRFNLNAVLCGAEGTLGTVVEAELSVLPLPVHAALVNLRYRSFDAALRDARDLIATAPAAVETIDGTVLGLARGDAVWARVTAFFPGDETAAEGITIVEYVDETAEGLEAQLARAKACLHPRRGDGRLMGYTIARDPAAVAAIWAMRKKAVGLLGNMSGPARPVPFVEDVAVPPERLADFIAAFRSVLDSHGLHFGMFGHVDAGVLHVRPALDMTDPRHRGLIRPVTDAVVALTRAHGGVLWGEHGKGIRSEYAPATFGPLYPVMQTIKAAFDPDNRLNPGKIAAPSGGELLRIDAVAMRGARDALVPAIARDTPGNAFHCNGNGLCFDFDTDHVMCPSYRATRDRRHSPKGRAALMREWLTRLGEAGYPTAGGTSARTLLHWPRRAWNTLGWSRGAPDFSHDVKAVMDVCLSCKGCTGQCPIKVDVPAFRSTFLEAYYGRYLRPPAAVLIAWVEHLLPLLARIRPFYAVAVESDAGKALLGRIGLTALPSMPFLSPRKELARRNILVATPDRLATLDESERQRSVILIADAFTRSFEPAVVLDVVDLVSALGWRPWLAPARPSGKALLVQGMRAAFRSAASRHAAELRALAAFGLPLVGIDPALTLVYRAEYVSELGRDAAPTVRLLQEWLSRACDHLDPPRGISDVPAYTLLPHCTEQATAASATALWVPVFARFGLTLTLAETGCCGMAGTFGHELRHRDVSAAIYRLSWRDKVRDGRGEGAVLATGYSCRSQAKLVDGAILRHPAQVLSAALRDAAKRQGAGAVERSGSS